MDWTDRHCRYFHRLLTRRTLLYTEMVTTGAILHGDRQRLLAYSPEEHPLALQIGGDDPQELATCAAIAEDLGFDEVNLNVGCPSDRVQRGRIGACLMAAPDVVAEGVAAMRSRVQIPITVKHRIGIDDLDRYEDLLDFVTRVSRDGGASTFIVHARKAWLHGLSPKQNREVPPLRYEDVYRLKRDLPHLAVELNGGVTSLDEVEGHLERIDGVMLGRSAYHMPYLLASADLRIFSDPSAKPTSRREVVSQFADYCDRQVAAGQPLARLTRHILGLYHGCPGARGWRRRLTEEARLPGSDGNLVRAALSRVEGIPTTVLA
jgi:tRNA-dihydrouridine synthase A